jgi:hypothetical protein
MKKGRRASPGETQLDLLPNERTLFSELGKRAAAVNAATEEITQGLAKGTGLARIKNALASLRDETCRSGLLPLRRSRPSVAASPTIMRDRSSCAFRARSRA